MMRTLTRRPGMTTGRRQGWTSGRTTGRRASHHHGGEIIYEHRTRKVFLRRRQLVRRTIVMTIRLVPVQFLSDSLVAVHHILCFRDAHSVIVHHSRWRRLHLLDDALLFLVLLVLHASVLEPDFDLTLAEVQQGSHLYSAWTTEISVEVKLLLEFHQLCTCIRSTCPL